VETTSPTTAQGRYETLKSERDPFLRRAEEVVSLTIPTLLPREGHSATSELPQPYQSVGARGINNLSAKVLLALFPPGSSFFRLTLDDKVLEDLTKEFGSKDEIAKAQTALEAGLAAGERAVLKRLETTGARAVLFDTARQLFACGNVLLQVLEGGKLRNHYLNSYVCKRDPEGNPLEIIFVEHFARATLPPKVLEIVESVEQGKGKSNASVDNVIDVFTHVKLDGSEWNAYQEVMGKMIPGTEGTYPKEKSPFIPLRGSRIEGESYGRGMGEENLGDLRSVESLSQSLIEFAGIAANIKFLVDPAGITKADSLARSRNGAFIKGTAKDVTVLSLEKFADFRVAKEMLDQVEKRLGEAFLLGTAAVRDAERVTAEEIRLIAGELEQALGGLYSVLAIELQLPLVARLMYVMQKEKAFPALPEGAVRPSIVTGMEALGRGGDLIKLKELVAETAELFGPDEVKKYIDAGDYLLRKSIALGIDAKGLIRSKEEVAGINQQQTAENLVGKLGPQALKNAQEQQTAATSAQPLPENIQ
jgi:hypothetical protein